MAGKQKIPFYAPVLDERGFLSQVWRNYFQSVEAAGGNVSDIVLPNGQIFVGNAANIATAVAMSGDVTISNAGVTSIRNSVALSVLGRAANSVGHPADISTTAGAGGFLRESSGVLLFGPITDADLPSGILDFGVSLTPATATRNLVSPTDAAFPALILRGHSSQTANLEEWQAFGGGVRAAVAPDGSILVGAGNATGGRLRLSAGTLYLENNPAATQGDINLGGVLVVHPATPSVSIDGDLILGSNSQARNLILTGAAGQARDLTWETAGARRWVARAGTGAESGADAGSDWALIARHDDSTQIDAPITIVRAAGGGITLARDVSISRANSGNPVSLALRNTSNTADSAALFSILNGGALGGDAGILMGSPGVGGFAIGYEASSGHLVFSNDDSAIGSAGIFAHFDSVGNFEMDKNIAIGGTLFAGGAATIEKAVAGADFRSVFKNLDNSAGSNATLEIAVGGGSAGNPKLLLTGKAGYFDITAQKIGGHNAMVMTLDGTEHLKFTTSTVYIQSAIGLQIAAAASSGNNFAYFDSAGNIGNSGIDIGSFANVKTVKVTISHTDLQAAALTNDIEIFALPALGKWLGCVARVTTAFAGSFSEYDGSIGLSANLAKYLPLSDFMGTVTNNSGFVDGTEDVPDFVSPSSIRLHVEADAFLNTSIAGSIDVWISYLILP